MLTDLLGHSCKPNATRLAIKEMELNRVPEAEMIGRFELVVVPEIRVHVREIREHHGENWKAFKVALKEEYFMEDAERVTDQDVSGTELGSHLEILEEILPCKYPH